ncbi:MAG: hypothetical protein WC460_02660 [Patescibacteria group bacterium]
MWGIKIFSQALLFVGAISLLQWESFGAEALPAIKTLFLMTIFFGAWWAVLFYAVKKAGEG